MFFGRRDRGRRGVEDRPADGRRQPGAAALGAAALLRWNLPRSDQRRDGDRERRVHPR